MSRLTYAIAAIAWISTLALAFMMGRVSVLPSIETDRKPARVSVARPTAEPVAPMPTSTPSRPPASEYPRYTSTIPANFRGRWDEIVSDKCEGREARFTFNGSSVFNFEVEQEVSRVKLYSPTEIDIDVTGYDDDKNQYNDTLSLKLVEGGTRLTGRKEGASFFRKCPTS